MLQLVGINVAIVAGFLGVFAWYANNKKNEIERRLEDVVRTSMLQQQLANATANALFDIRASAAIHGSLIAKVWGKCHFSTDEWTRVEQALARDENVVQRALQTLVLYTSMSDRRLSAFKQLGQHLGDADTLECLLELKRFELEHVAELSLAIRAVKHRLNERHRDMLLHISEATSG
jgi:hypothetical protein